MSRIALMYFVGFAGVWGAVGLWCMAMAAFRSFSRDWDRAFQRELMGDRLLVASSRDAHRSDARGNLRFERDP
jgi:hypothetical protein